MERVWWDEGAKQTGSVSNLDNRTRRIESISHMMKMNDFASEV